MNEEIYESVFFLIELQTIAIEFQSSLSEGKREAGVELEFFLREHKAWSERKE